MKSPSNQSLPIKADSKGESQAPIPESPPDPSLTPFAVISTCYLLFTVTDGAIRMIVLLHAYSKSFSALQVALMFTLYELAGVFTNLFAGLAGARWGIRRTMICGLCLQVLSFGMLFFWDDSWTKETAIVYVTVASMFGGIAKDLTKLGGKTVTKLVTKEGQNTKLFKLVSILTGMKNSLKGVGYFLGSALINVSYPLALACMMALIIIALPFAIFGLTDDLGTAKKSNATLSQVFNLKNRNLSILSLARMFLFASRDFWFEVPLPFYLRSPDCEDLGPVEVCDSTSSCIPGAVCDSDDGYCVNQNPGGGCGGLGYDKVVVGAFLAGYIILYGQVQSWTPQLVTGPLGQTPPNRLTEVLWGVINILPTMFAALVIFLAPSFQDNYRPGMTGYLVVIIVTFAIIFAINSSIHSYLVVKYASRDKVAVSVGFYYMSNAAGRLFGTLGSGLIYSYVGDDRGSYAGSDGTAGLAWCMIAGSISSLLAALITTRIDDQDSGLKCGSIVCCKSIEVEEGDVEEMEGIKGGENVDKDKEKEKEENNAL